MNAMQSFQSMSRRSDRGYSNDDSNRNNRQRGRGRGTRGQNNSSGSTRFGKHDCIFQSVNRNSDFCQHLKESFC